MNIQQFTNNMRAAVVVERMLKLAGTDYEKGLAPLLADSEKQRQFGADIRIRALADIWEQVDGAFLTPETANAILRAANRHPEAIWWIARNTHTMAPGGFNDLDSDIDQELEQK